MESKGTSFFKSQPIFILDHETNDILDMNCRAINLYGYSRNEFLSMNLNDLGVVKKRVELTGSLQEADNSADKIWIHKSKEGKELFIQFTYHVFNYEDRPAKFAVAHDVSRQVEAREKRRIKFPKYVTHESNYPLAEIEWDVDLRVKNWSEKAEELFGWKESEILCDDQFFNRFIADEELEAARRKVKNVIESHQTHYSVEGKIKTKNGRRLTCRWYNSIIYDEKGRLLSMHSLVTDITKSKETESLFRALAEESLIGVYLIQDGEFIYVNPRFAEIFGYEQKEIQHNLGPLNLAHPDDRDKVQENIRQRLEGEAKSKAYDFKCVTKDGDVVEVSVYGSVISFKGKPAVMGTLVDITGDKDAIQKYRASVESFQDLFDSISDAIYILDKDGRFLEVNRGAVEMYGYEQQFFIGKTPEVLAAPGKVDLVKTRELIQKALTGEPQSFEWWGRRKNGEVFPKEVVVNPGTYFGEDVVIANGRDISERYEADKMLRESEEMFRQLFLNAPMAIAFMDERQEIKTVNKAFTDVFGYSTEDVRGLDIDRLIVPDDEMEIAQKISKDVLEGESGLKSGRRIRKDKSLIDVFIYGVPVIVDGKTVAIFGIYIDISERKEAEEKIKKSLKEKEVLLAEIHHRVKNNLAVITGLLELQSYNTSSEEASSVLKASQMRINSIALVHEKLYQNEDLSEISFDVYIKQLTDVITSSLSSDATAISIQIEAEAVKLTVGQAIPCGLIINELITNAHKHAFPGRKTGSIHISLIEEDLMVKLQVSDDGVGIPLKADLDNPKSLGLTLIRTLSKQLNGKAAFSDHKPGTQFNLEFELQK
ncbi:MAG TPA: PAS domain S-box protein [Balneolaceae bacterium]